MAGSPYPSIDACHIRKNYHPNYRQHDPEGRISNRTMSILFLAAFALAASDVVIGSAQSPLYPAFPFGG
jgi:hypothetical protein